MVGENGVPETPDWTYVPPVVMVTPLRPPLLWQDTGDQA